jgi:serine/threonine protein kinase
MNAPLTQLGRYRIIAELGRGAMGVVYKAHDSMLDRTVAIKTILVSSDAEVRAEYEARFHQEAKAAARLNHPNIITVHDIGREGDINFMAMELLEGVDLRELMKRGPLPLSLAFDIASQVADGLAFAHEHGIVHRDIKPGNIMIVRERHAKIMDFGIARMRLSDVKTQTGAMLGSPKYMSPEQINGERADHRSDVFSLGVTVFEMLTGQAPFSGAELGQLMYQVAHADTPAASSVNPALPTMIDLVLAKALEKAPDARYQDAREFAADLRTCKEQLEFGPASVEFPLDGTVKSDPASDKTIPLATAAITTGSEATRTERLTATVRSVPTSMQLALSRRFDSAQAISRLGRGAEDSSSGTDPLIVIKRFLRDPDQRSLAKWIVAAGIASIFIALV